MPQSGRQGESVNRKWYGCYSSFLTLCLDTPITFHLLVFKLWACPRTKKGNCASIHSHFSGHRPWINFFCSFSVFRVNVTRMTGWMPKNEWNEKDAWSHSIFIFFSFFDSLNRYASTGLEPMNGRVNFVSAHFMVPSPGRFARTWLPFHSLLIMCVSTGSDCGNRRWLRWTYAQIKENKERSEIYFFSFFLFIFTVHTIKR